MSSIIAMIVALLFFLAGIAGTLVPILPGAPVIWLGMLSYALIVGFEQFSISFFLAQALLALTVMGVDYLFAVMGSRYFGGTKAALWGAAAGLLVGIFFFPIGLLIGPFLGAALADLLFRKNAGQAVKSGIGASFGFWSALPIKLAIEAVMISWFILRIF